jgi:hypothetical protein
MKDDILPLINDILKSQYKTVDDIPSDKLQRAWMILRINQILHEHPEKKIFLSRLPSTTPEGM